MKEIKIESSNIKSIFYNKDKKELQVFFKSHSLYIYKNIDNKLITEFENSKDKGKYFYENIRGLEFEKKY